MLEIGFGPGVLLKLLAARMRWGRLAGPEASPLMLKTAARRLRGSAVDLDLRLGLGPELPWPSDFFDAVAYLHAFQFWADPAGEFAEVVRVLEPGGALVMALRDHSRLEDRSWLPNPASRSGDEVGETLRLLADAGFAAEKAGSVRGSPMLIARKSV